MLASVTKFASAAIQAFIVVMKVAGSIEREGAVGRGVIGIR
jgi:hypothetical protein